MVKLYFDFRDIFRAARFGFSGKKIGLQFLGLLIGYIGYAILTYIALIASGIGFAANWASYRLFPTIVASTLPWYGWVLYVAGLVFFVIMWLVYSTAAAKVTYQQLKGDDFYTAREALGFVGKNWKAVILSPLMVIAIVVFLLVCGIIIGLLGKIPYVGELGFALLSIPIFGVALFLVFLAVVFGVGIILGPAIVATAREDSFETMIQFFSSIWSQTWRFVVYDVLLGAITIAGVYVLGSFSYWALKLVYVVCGWTMGPKLHNMAMVAINWLPTKWAIWSLWSKGLWCGKLAAMTSYMPSPVTLQRAESVAAFIMGIFLVLIFGFVISYGLSIWSAGQTLIYLILRKRKDDENLLEREDEEEEKIEEAKVEEKEEKAPPAEEKKEKAKEEKPQKGEKKK
ncbi:MAG: hypothetical protein AMJ92_09595 [candidate division Zixibacteria bacterium SM23_81]|nr:MAG: hypothetical protein AMJ92_09595 [candidate division Zixibacteria bacterium SM23_81]